MAEKQEEEIKKNDCARDGMRNKKKHDITPPTLTKPSKTLFRKGFPKSTSTSTCGDSTVASKCACGILCTTKTTCNSNSKVEYKTTTTTNRY
jgi:hypothetical protein